MKFSNLLKKVLVLGTVSSMFFGFSNSAFASSGEPGESQNDNYESIGTIHVNSYANNRFIYPRMSKNKGIGQVLIWPGFPLHHLDWTFYYMLYDVTRDGVEVGWTTDFRDIKASQEGTFEAYFFIVDNKTGEVVYPPQNLSGESSNSSTEESSALLNSIDAV